MSVTMQWAVKDSLGEYIQSIEDGKISLTAPSIQGDIGYSFVADDENGFDGESKTLYSFRVVSNSPPITA